MGDEQSPFFVDNEMNFCFAVNPLVLMAILLHSYGIC